MNVRVTAADRRYMRLAVALARRYVGQTAPNPAVGAVVVRDGRIVGWGAHVRAGRPHAEVVALERAGASARGATLYVTLEPCHHHGRTPPCSHAVHAAGIQRLVVGQADPNPEAAGSLAWLARQGIEVAAGVEPELTAALIADFRTWVTARRPFVVYKVAATWDGAIASAQGRREPISGPASRLRVHRLRATVNAVVVGAETWRRDRPDLGPYALCKKATPWRVVVGGALPELPVDPEERERAPRTLWFVRTATPERRRSWTRAGAQVELLPEAPAAAPVHVVRRLGELGASRILLEGGARLAASFLAADLIDWIVLVHGPWFVGGPPGVGLFGGERLRPPGRGWRWRPTLVYRIGDDWWCEGPAPSPAGTNLLS